jgi:hypothetical protein
MMNPKIAITLALSLISCYGWSESLQQDEEEDCFLEELFITQGEEDFEADDDRKLFMNEKPLATASDRDLKSPLKQQNQGVKAPIARKDDDQEEEDYYLEEEQFIVQTDDECVADDDRELFIDEKSLASASDPDLKPSLKQKNQVKAPVAHEKPKAVAMNKTQSPQAAQKTPFASDKRVTAVQSSSPRPAQRAQVKVPSANNNKCAPVAEGNSLRPAQRSQVKPPSAKNKRVAASQSNSLRPAQGAQVKARSANDKCATADQNNSPRAAQGTQAQARTPNKRPLTSEQDSQRGPQGGAAKAPNKCSPPSNQLSQKNVRPSTPPKRNLQTERVAQNANTNATQSGNPRPATMNNSSLKREMPPIQDQGFNVYGAFLYWKNMQENLSYAIREKPGVVHPVPHTDLVTIIGHIRTVEYDWDCGFRVGLGYRAGANNWDVYTEYTHFWDTGSDTQTFPQPFRGPGGNPANVPPFDYLKGLFLDLDGPNIYRVHSKAKLNYNVWDLVLQRPFYETQSLVMRFLFGGRGTFIKQHWRSVYLGITPGKLKTTITNNWHFKGGGLRGGANLEWLWKYGLGLHFQASASLVLGRFENVHKNIDVAPLDAIRHQQTIKRADIHPNSSRLIPAYEMLIGLQWRHSWGKWGLSLFADWELNRWVDLNQTYYYPRSVYITEKVGSWTRDAVSLQGLTTGFKVEF